MKPRFWQVYTLAAVLCRSVFADAGSISSLTVTNNQATIEMPRVPGTQQYKVYGTTDLNLNFAEIVSGAINGWTWKGGATNGQSYYLVGAVPQSQTDMLTALALNRLGYGPTPDELERVKAMGPEAYIAEQLAPESITESLDIDVVNTSGDWQRVVATGTATSQDFYIYLTAPGDAYLDDLKMVAGTNPDATGNLFQNPGFDTSLINWTVSDNHTNSVIVTTGQHTGAGALHIIATEGGTTKASSIWQTLTGVTVNNTYTLSYWWKPGSNSIPPLELRFSSSGIDSTPATPAARLQARTAQIGDLRAWHIQHGVRSKKQLEETLLQFLENHFVTQYTKTFDYMDNYLDGNDRGAWATYFEYKENKKWRAALEQPTCTFSNLLTISAESPAMIIYLDTVNSKGNGSNIPNENYARELMELFTFGVDNGYDQNDIVLMSRVWTGWSVEIVDTNNETNPLAPMSTTLKPGGTNNPTNPRSQLAGVWSFNYKAGNHWTRSGTILFPGKTVPARFGAPYAGRSYEFAVDIQPPSPDWQQVVVTGTATSSTLYMYLNSPGDIYLDDVQIVAGSTPGVGTTKVNNGGFETALTGPWNVSANLAGSAIVTTEAHSGTHSLHMVASDAGSSQNSAIWQTLQPLTSGATYTLSFWWKPGAATLPGTTIRLSGSGIVANAPQRLGGNGLADAYRVIGHLSDQPFTQEFISVKLCRLFVHDNFAVGYDFTDPNLSPEGKLVRACMDAWENNTPKGQIRKVLQTIFASDLFRGQGAAMHKVRTPLEYVVASVRALRSENPDGTATASTDGASAASAVARMGNMKLFDRAEPDGYPEAAAPWISAGTLAERLRWVQALCTASGTGHDPANPSFANPVALLKKKLPSAQWANDQAVVDYFLSILLPGEGKANLDLYRSAAIKYLNTLDDGLTPSAFSGLGTSTTIYDTRVRGMVSAIMTSQRFHEQ